MIRKMIHTMKPKRRPGAVAKVTACPYCGVSMSQNRHQDHRAECEQYFRMAPPQAAEFRQDPGGGFNRDGTFPQT